MADTIKGGLGFADPSKLNQYGAKEEDISEYQQSLQDSINALQMRYAQPNWFNVAAGFFKPQLGGFTASLGSASEALGQNIEKQRESQLPIAQMRSQLALSKITMGQNKQAADLVKEWEGRKSPPGEMAALAQKLGHPVAASVVYRMLARHGWRKVAPDTRHPKSDPQVQEEWKKTPRNSGSAHEARRCSGSPGALDVPGRGTLWSNGADSPLLGT